MPIQGRGLNNVTSQAEKSRHLTSALRLGIVILSIWTTHVKGYTISLLNIILPNRYALHEEGQHERLAQNSTAVTHESKKVTPPNACSIPNIHILLYYKHANESYHCRKSRAFHDSLTLRCLAAALS